MALVDDGDLVRGVALVTISAILEEKLGQLLTLLKSEDLPDSGAAPGAQTASCCFSAVTSLGLSPRPCSTTAPRSSA